MQPTCIRCTKRGIECDGPKATTWVDHSNQFTTHLVLTEPSPTTSQPVELSFAAFKDDICLAYTRKHLLRGGVFELACRMINFSDTASIFSRNPALGLLRTSIISLAMTFFGSQHHQDKIVAKGYHQYGEVLRDLNNAIASSERQTSDEIILTALMCTLLEVFLPTGPTNFLTHQRGLEAMMELRGPPTKSTGPTATIFRGLRMLSIAGALADSRPSIYAREDWKFAPAEHVNDVGVLRYNLFTVLADCTSLLSERDALLKSGLGYEYHGILLARVDVTLHDLIELYPLWELCNDSQYQGTEQQSVLEREMGVANQLCMLYHVAYLCLLQIKDTLQPLPTHVALRSNAAMTIARCLELKAHEKEEGAPESNTIAFVVTKVIWQALGGFDLTEANI
jgi:hypothetical protein